VQQTSPAPEAAPAPASPAAAAVTNLMPRAVAKRLWMRACILANNARARALDELPEADLFLVFCATQTETFQEWIEMSGLRVEPGTPAEENVRLAENERAAADLVARGFATRIPVLKGAN
jgi:hypothetical protein